MLLFSASTNLSYRIFTYANEKFICVFVRVFTRLDFTCPITFTNPTTDWKIVMQQRAWFYAVCVSAPNLFGLVLYDVINYNDVISATDSYESVEDFRFTDV